MSCVSLDTILLTKDFFEAEYSKPVTLNYVEGGVKIICENKRDERIFLDEMHDFIKRKAVVERTQTVKEIIIGRALYGVAEKCQ